MRSDGTGEGTTGDSSCFAGNKLDGDGVVDGFSYSVLGAGTLTGDDGPGAGLPSAGDCCENGDGVFLPSGDDGDGLTGGRPFFDGAGDGCNSFDDEFDKLFVQFSGNNTVFPASTDSMGQVIQSSSGQG